MLESRIPPDPLVLARRWLDDGRGGGVREPEAMALATVSDSGKPSVRMVLLKGIDENGITFYTNYESRKGRELGSNPNAALLLYWDALVRQLRIEGTVTKVSADESARYFATRPRMSRIGAWASRQSSSLRDRAELEQAVARVRRQFAGKDIPLPASWGGYRIVPASYEFWQGRTNRLHDRILFTLLDGTWTIQRLAP